jgi:hypothetical protein
VQSLIGFSHTGISRVPVTHGVKNFCGRDEIGNAGGRLDPFGNPGAEPIDEDYCFETRTARTSGSFFNDYDDDRIRYTVKSDANYFLDNFLGVSHTMKAGVQIEKNKYERTFRCARSRSSMKRSLASAVSNPRRSPAAGRSIARSTSPAFPSSRTRTLRDPTTRPTSKTSSGPIPTSRFASAVRLQQENLKAEGFKHFDPREEAHAFQEGYDQCAPPGDPGRCARQNFHFFHTYESFPVSGASRSGPSSKTRPSGVQHREIETFRISNTNVAPRFSVSWDPGTNGKTKLFGSAGRFYGDTFLAIPLYEQPPDSFGFEYTVTPDLQCSNDPDGNGPAASSSRRSSPIRAPWSSRRPSSRSTAT